MTNKEQILAAIDELPTLEREALLSELSTSVAEADGDTCAPGYYMGTDGKCYKDPLTEEEEG